MHRSKIPALITVLILLALSGCSEPISMDKEGKVYLLNAARAVLEGKELPANHPLSVKQKSDGEVFVCLFGHEPVFLSEMGTKGCILDKVVQAAGLIKQNPEFSSIFEKKMGKTRITVHIVKSTVKLNTYDPKKLKRKLEPGVYGLKMTYKGDDYYQLGEEVLWRGWSMEGEKRILGTKLAAKRLRKMAIKADISIEDMKKSKLFRFSTIDFMEVKRGGGDKHVPLFRGNWLRDKKLDRAEILEAATLGGRNLIKNQKPNGKYGYIYYPTHNRFDKGYNIVRHAGTTYSLFQIYKATGDPAFKDGALAALEFIKPNIQNPDESMAILVDRGKSALGANALLALALVEMPKHVLQRNQHFIKLRDRLGNTLLKFQMEDGSFYAKYRQLEQQRPPKKQPMYYPGETFLAFVRLYEETKDEKYIKAAQKAADYQIDDFKNSGTPDNWAIQAYSRFYRQRQEDKYAKACYEMADELLTHQWGTFKSGKMPYKDFYGGFDNGWPPRSTPAASRTEALTEAYALAEFRGDKDRMEKYSKAVLGAWWFTLNQQYNYNNSYYLPKPGRAFGGIKGSPIANDIRIDYTQHTITGLLHGIQIAEKKNGLGELNPDLKIIDVEKSGLNLQEVELKVIGLQKPLDKEEPEKPKPE